MLKEKKLKVITCYSYACMAKKNSTGELVFNLECKNSPKNNEIAVSKV